MARYIDADALFEPNESTDKVLVLGRNGGKTIALAEKMMRERVNMAPTLTLDDLRPRGYWIGVEADGYADGVPVYNLWQCSECGEEVEGEDVTDTHPFCHGCGADMRGGGEEVDSNASDN